MVIFEKSDLKMVAVGQSQNVRVTFKTLIFRFFGSAKTAKSGFCGQVFILKTWVLAGVSAQ